MSMQLSRSPNRTFGFQTVRGIRKPLYTKHCYDDSAVRALLDPQFTVSITPTHIVQDAAGSHETRQSASEFETKQPTYHHHALLTSCRLSDPLEGCQTAWRGDNAQHLVPTIKLHSLSYCRGI
jgi:hypothetical protein